MKGYNFITVATDDDSLKEKNYNPNIWTILNNLDHKEIWEEEGVQESKYYIYDKKELKNKIRATLIECKNLKTGGYKAANRFYDAFVELNFFIEKDDKVIVYPWKTQYINIPLDLADYALNNFTSQVFKVYCILFNIKKTYGNEASFCYTGKNGLIVKCGYALTRNVKVVNSFSLAVKCLVDCGLVDCSDEAYTKFERDTYTGKYFNLYKVNTETNTSQQNKKEQMMKARIEQGHYKGAWEVWEESEINGTSYYIYRNVMDFDFEHKKTIYDYYDNKFKGVD